MKISELLENLLTVFTENDAVITIPLQVINKDEGESYADQIDSSVIMQERLNLEDDDPRLKAMYLAALGSLMCTCFERYDRAEILDYMTSIVEFTMTDNQTKH